MTAESPRYLFPFDSYALPHHLADVLVVGTGVAGYSAALAAADAGARVLIIAKGDPLASNTGWAQGGVAAALEDSDDDSPDQHAADTCEVGQGLCDEALVHDVCDRAAAAVARLIELGARFDPEPGASGRVARGLEGGHSKARILHARGDATGAEIRDTLARAAKAHPRIEQWGGCFLVDILTDDDGACRGALVLMREQLRALWAGAVVLCAGGYAQIYRESTNVPGATGDGVACARRAGAIVQDMEFVQFHPTTLYLAGVPRMLITEAVRGAGAYVVDDHGERFLTRAHEQAELAPRDVISRAIVRHLEREDVDGVYLDLSHLDAPSMAARFPGVVASCAAHGLDVAKDRIPIRPAAHYSIGGVRTDRHGHTSVPRLLAAGEVAATGLHGANRLASNSLLEGLVMGRSAGEQAAEVAKAARIRPRRLRGLGTGAARGSMDVDDLRTSLKAVLWREAGILRQGAWLAGALGAVQGWEGFAHRVGSGTPPRLSLINMLSVARLATRSALLREESRGTHFRLDFPERDDEEWRVRLVYHPGESDPRREAHPAAAEATTRVESRS